MTTTTVGELLKFLHRFPSTTTVEVSSSLMDARHGGPVRLDLSGNEYQGRILLVYEPPGKGAGKDGSDESKAIVDEALDQCDRIADLCEQVPERGEDFASSVLEKVESIRDWIEENDHVTEKQLKSLENMEAGVLRWVERD